VEGLSMDGPSMDGSSVELWPLLSLAVVLV
jgi:hypothetical protein